MKKFLWWVFVIYFIAFVFGGGFELADLFTDGGNDAAQGSYYLYDLSGGDGTSTDTSAWLDKESVYDPTDYIHAGAYEIDSGTIVEKLGEGYKDGNRRACKIRVLEDVGVQINKGLEVWVACRDVQKRGSGPMAEETFY